MGKRLHNLNRDDIIRQRSVGVPWKELVRQTGASESTLRRCVNESEAESNRACCTRWYRHGAIDPVVKKICKVCFGEFETTPTSHKETCGNFCKKLYTESKAYYTQIPKRLLFEHVATYGLTDESAARLGMNLEQLKRGLA